MMATFTEAPCPDVRTASAAFAASAIGDGRSGVASGGSGASIPAMAIARPSSNVRVAPSVTEATRAAGALPTVHSVGSFAAASASDGGNAAKIAVRARVGRRIRRTDRAYHGQATRTVPPALQVA